MIFWSLFVCFPFGSFAQQPGNLFGNMYYNPYFPQSASPFYDPISNPSGAIPITTQNNNSYYTPAQWGQACAQSLQIGTQNMLAGLAAGREERLLQMQEELMADRYALNASTAPVSGQVAPLPIKQRDLDSQLKKDESTKLYVYKDILDTSEGILTQNRQFYAPNDYEELAMLIAYMRFVAPSIKSLGHILYIERNGPEWIKDTIVGNEGKELLLMKIYKSSESEFVRDSLPKGKLVYEDKNGLAWQDPTDDSVVIMTAERMMGFLKQAKMIKNSKNSAKVLCISRVSLKPYSVDIPL
jgi:hypothetical protein